MSNSGRMHLGEFAVTQLIKFAGYSAILFVITIFIFLVREGFPSLGEVQLDNLLSDRWYPIEGLYGILPLLVGTVIVTIGAIAVAMPFGLATAIFISEVSPRRFREILKPAIELLGGVPSVVLGFIGILVLAPYLRELFELPTGLSAFTGSLILGIIALPTVVSVAEDALDNVPQSYRQAAWAMGATEWQTIWMVTLPAARSGVLTAVMLGVGRAIGETMVVLMVTGNAPVMFNGLDSFVSPVRTMTATIAAEMGEVASGSVHYHVLFLVGITLFLITLTLNVTVSAVVFRRRKRAERLLS
ncbi:MAG TPA: phosphate ABC transporter permease subunit PstC [Anaerolineales bacterium]|nr:phosphate ABC transporter permease subunit PstC [Anaerolineales bacterium]